MNMEQEIKTALSSALERAGEHGTELTRFFIEHWGEEKSRARVLCLKLFQQPITLFFILIFAPLILIASILKDVRIKSESLDLFQKIKISLLMAGLSIACLLVWLAVTWVGGSSGFWLLSYIFGIITVLGFLISIFISLIITAVLQIVIFKLTCLFFLQLSKTAIIQSFLKEYLTNEVQSAS